MSGRRELTAAVLAAVAAGGLALSAGGQAWAEFTTLRPAPLPPVEGRLTGSEVAPLVPAAGLVLLAAALALLAVRGAGRVLVGLLMALAGGVLVWSGLRTLTGGLDAIAPELSRVAETSSADVSAAWPMLAIVAGLLGVAAGVLVVLRGRAWPAMGRRYERTTAADGGTGSRQPPRPETDEDRAQAAWKALDRGEDPTDPGSAPPGGRPA